MSSLLSLPGELKFKIYGYCIPRDIEVEFNTHLRALDSPPANPALPLLRTCKAIYADIIRFPKTTIVVAFHSYYALYTVLKDTWFSSRKHISKIRMAQKDIVQAQSEVSDHLMGYHIRAYEDLLTGCFERLEVVDSGWTRIQEKQAAPGRVWVETVVDLEVGDAIMTKHG